MARTDAELDALVRRLPAPPLSDDVREARLAALLAEVERDLDGGGPPPPRRRRWTRRRVVLVASGTALVLAGAGTAVAALAIQRAQTRDVAHCFPIVTTDFDNPALGPDVTIVGSDTAAGAVEACAAEWRSGALVATPPYAGSPGPTPEPVPDLAACVLPSGVVGVFPGPGDTCERLGLPRSAG